MHNYNNGTGRHAKDDLSVARGKGLYPRDGSHIVIPKRTSK